MKLVKDMDILVEGFSPGVMERLGLDYDTLKKINPKLIMLRISNFGQTGPWLVTPDEFDDPQNLSMWLEVNGERVQNGSTKTMVYGVAHLVSYLSRFMTLEPGDIISTGTPPGVGLGFNPPRYLKAGDVVELGIEKLGTQKQVCIADV